MKHIVRLCSVIFFFYSNSVPLHASIGTVVGKIVHTFAATAGYGLSIPLKGISSSFSFSLDGRASNSRYYEYSQDSRNYYGEEQHGVFKHYSSHDFQNYLSMKIPLNTPGGFYKAVFESYMLYQYQRFRDYVRDLPGYEDFIIKLEKEINNKKSDLREKLKYVAGFETNDCGFCGIGSSDTIYGFHKFVHQEKDRILSSREFAGKEWKEQQRQQQIEREKKQQLYQAESHRIKKIYNALDTQQNSLNQLETNPNRSSTVIETYESLTVIQQNIDYEEITLRTENLIDLGFSLLESNDCIAEQDAVHLVQTLENPDQLTQITLSQESLRLFGNSLNAYNQNSSDFIERKIITTINTTAEVCNELDLTKEHHRTIHNNLSKAVITNKTSLVVQADCLNNQNRVEEAYGVTRTAKGLIHCCRAVAIFADSTLHTFTGQAYKTVQPYVRAISSLFDGMCYTFSHPAEVAENVFSFMTQELGPDFNYGAKESIELGSRAKSAVINKATSIIDLAHTLGSAGAEFAMTYGHSFTTQEDLYGLDEQTQQEMYALADQQRQALREKIIEIAQSTTPEQCGKVVGTLTAEWVKVHCFNKGIGWLASSLVNIRRANSAAHLVDEVEKIKSTAATKAITSIETVELAATKMVAIEKRIQAITCSKTRKALGTILENHDLVRECRGLENLVNVMEKISNSQEKRSLYKSSIDKILQSKKNVANIKGAFFEMEDAIRITGEYEKIVGLNVIERLPSGAGLEIDIVTNTSIIECKNWSFWNQERIKKVQNIMGQRLKLAKHLNKKLEFHSKYKIPEALQNWFEKKKIIFKDML